MTHRSIIKFLIICVISIVVAWSVVNISDYAHTFHASWVVWTMGAALGTANALSVYAFVMAKSAEVQRPAVIGIVLFGGMSGALQVLLYLQVGAPLLAAVAFGCFGPVAEGVLAWLHAALSEEPQPARKPAQPQRDVQRPQPAAGTQRQPQEAQLPATAPASQPAAPATSERARTAYALAQAQRPQKEIAAELGVSLRTVQADLAEVRNALTQQNGVHS